MNPANPTCPICGALAVVRTDSVHPVPLHDPGGPQERDGATVWTFARGGSYSWEEGWRGEHLVVQQCPRLTRALDAGAATLVRASGEGLPLAVAAAFADAVALGTLSSEVMAESARQSRGRR